MTYRDLSADLTKTSAKSRTVPTEPRHELQLQLEEQLLCPTQIINLLHKLQHLQCQLYHLWQAELQPLHLLHHLPGPHMITHRSRHLATKERVLHVAK